MADTMSQITSVLFLTLTTLLLQNSLHVIIICSLFFVESGEYVVIYDCKIRRDETSKKYLGNAIECLHTTTSTIVKVFI